VARVIDKAIIGAGEYERLYQQSIESPETFWGDIAEKETEWKRKWDRVYDGNRSWFVGGKLNITEDCLDRHVRDGFGDLTAIISVDEDGLITNVSYCELLERVSRMANYLNSSGINKGDRVVIYMPLVVEQVVAMLACARIGAIHSVVFAGLSATAVQYRLDDLEPKLIITADFTKRRGKKIDLLSTIREANAGLEIKTLVLFRGERIALLSNECDWEKEIKKVGIAHVAGSMAAEDPLFVLYTSGTTGKPKGIVHSIGGYHVYTHFSAKVVFNLNRGDVYWCTADVGWITGHSYVVYGPLSIGATVLLVEGAPDYPTTDRWWSLIDQFGVNVFYTSPTAARLLMRYGEEDIKKYKFETLKVVGSVGEPLNPKVWQWLDEKVGRSKCVVVDTWWQTETGGQAIVTLPSMVQKPGKAGLPFFGIKVRIQDEDGQLIIENNWPAAMRTYWKDQKRFLEKWMTNSGGYLTGDLAARDADGYFQIKGRLDDVLNIAGHRVGSAEIENVLINHIAIAESAAIGVPNEIKGEIALIFVCLKQGYQGSSKLAEDLKQMVKTAIGHYVIIEDVQFVDKLPKTRSGKIMRRVLRAMALGKDPGDVSTQED